MKIIKITDEEILFVNGCKLTYYHEQDCYEHNYADFTQLEDTGIENEEFEFNTKMFEFKDGEGFRLIAQSGNKYFVPCYSYQNGYYSSDLNIIFDNGIDKCIVNINCKTITV